MTRTSIKFLQISDLHLDRSFSGGRLKLPYEKAQQRQSELREALQRAVELAKEQNVEVILIVGDLWEEELLAPDTVPFVIDVLSSANVPVVIAPGNHDYYSIGSHYGEEFVASRFDKWPPNIYIFRNYEWKHISIPELSGVIFSGLACGPKGVIHERLLKDPLDVPEADIRICLLHGSRDTNIPPGKDITLPFNDAELLAQPFDYVALGHYHSSSVITDSNGNIRAAYSGSTCALSVSDSGEHGVYIGIVQSGGVKQTDFKFQKIDKRSIHELSVDISSLAHTQAVEQRIIKRLSEANVQTEDIAIVRLEGTYPHGNHIPISDKIREACFHLEVDMSAVRPEWNLDDSGDSNTTEASFRKQLKVLIEKATTEGNNKQISLYTNALFYGLDALHNRPITPR